MTCRGGYGPKADGEDFDALVLDGRRVGDGLRRAAVVAALLAVGEHEDVALVHGAVGAAAQHACCREHARRDAGAAGEHAVVDAGLNQRSALRKGLRGSCGVAEPDNARVHGVGVQIQLVRE